MKQSRFETQVDGPQMLVRVHWQTPGQKWLVFSIITGFLLLLIWINEEENGLPLVAVPPVLYFAAVVALNRTEILVDAVRLLWRVRPLPFQPGRTVKLADAKHWIYGPLPGSGNKEDQRAVYGVGIEKADGKLLVIQRGFQTRSEAEDFIRPIAAHTTLPLLKLDELRGVGKERRVDSLAAVVLVLFLILLVWTFQQPEVWQTD